VFTNYIGEVWATPERGTCERKVGKETKKNEGRETEKNRRQKKCTKRQVEPTEAARHALNEQPVCGEANEISGVVDGDGRPRWLGKSKERLQSATGVVRLARNVEPNIVVLTQTSLHLVNKEDVQAGISGRKWGGRCAVGAGTNRQAALH
jgi:hypothetical protein